MPTFVSDGQNLAFDDVAPAGGHERTLILVHGFASNRHEGWRRTGWYQALERRRVRCVALDQRGHGESAKPHEPQAYERARMAGDVIALMDHLGLGQADLFGYSMGSRTALAAALAEPGRFSNLILGGVGGSMITERALPSGNPMADAMLAEDPETITEPILKSFRQFADEQGEDRRAIAAFTQAQNPPLDWDGLGALPMPVLVVTGQRDTLAGDPEALARSFAHGKGVVVPAADHFSAIPHALTKATVFDFIDGMLDDDFPAFE
jgi:pimeloyl-ACP methyl ester carboxylesterase